MKQYLIGELILQIRCHFQGLESVYVSIFEIGSKVYDGRTNLIKVYQ